MVPRSDPAIPIGAAAAVAEVVAEAAPSEGWRLVDPDRPGHAARVSTGPAPPRSGNGAQTSSRARGAAHHTAIVITYFAHRTERTTSVAPPAPSPGADPIHTCRVLVQNDSVTPFGFAVPIMWVQTQTPPPPRRARSALPGNESRSSHSHSRTDRSWAWRPGTRPWACCRRTQAPSCCPM